MSQDGKPPAPPAPQQSDDWRELAEKASKEADPAKMTRLIHELCDSIDRERAERHLPPVAPKKTAQGLQGHQQTG